jgi:DNA uptake protein ComE-like DNA-binding protein
MALAIALCRFALNLYPQALSLSPAQLAKAAAFSDAESLLAINQKLALYRVDLYDLELIPGISERLAEEIITHRDELLRHAASLPKNKQHQSLELIHGIGPKTARQLAKYITFEP